jgi:endonuclease YncB( thermonuclease family)
VSLQRPRRIFRATPIGTPRAASRVGLAVLGVLLLAGAAGLLAAMAEGTVSVSLPIATGTGTAARPVPVASVSAGPMQVDVVDGATLRLRDRVVRLFGITAPDRGEDCHDANGGTIDCGAKATTALASLVRARQVACRVEAEDRMGRAIAECEASGEDIGRALVAGGWARATDGAPALKAVETSARANHLGLWAFDPTTSW